MLLIVTGLALIAIWAAATAFLQAPGWIHLLFTVGLALWLYGIVKPRAPREG
jgi:predicted phage tail protein